MMKFEWDTEKAAMNLHKHGVSFDEAGTVFLDQLALSGPDPDHSMGEPRYFTFGISSMGRLLAVFHTHRPGHPHYQRTPCHPCRMEAI